MRGDTLTGCKRLERSWRPHDLDRARSVVDAPAACIAHCEAAREHFENGVVGRQPGEYVFQGPVVIWIRDTQEGGVGVDHSGFPGITHQDW